MRHIKNWVQLEIMTYLSIAALIITILSTYKKGVTPNTSSEFATSLTFSIFCTWTGGAQFEGSGSLLNTGLLFIVFDKNGEQDAIGNLRQRISSKSFNTIITTKYVSTIALP